MEFIQKSIQMDREKYSAQTQIALEDDINITDAKPDVYQLVTEKGQADVEEVRAMEDHEMCIRDSPGADDVHGRGADAV